MWQSMRTAPRDGTTFLVYAIIEGKDTLHSQNEEWVGFVTTCRWWAGNELNAPRWIVDNGLPSFPAYWQPMPAAPQLSEDALSERKLVEEEMLKIRQDYYDSRFGQTTF